MGNQNGDFVDTSDFFHTRTGVFGPRSAQVDIGRSSRAFLRARLDSRRDDLSRLVRQRLTPSSAWPDAGNLLVREHLRDVLLRREAPPEVHRTIEDIINRAVLAGARQRYSIAARVLFRRKAMKALAREIESRRQVGVHQPRDLIDVVIAGAGSSAAVKDLIEVYLSFVFATVGSIGFALAWSVFLLGTNPAAQSHSDASWIAREALRLWPVAWLFARRPKHAHDLGGMAVVPSDQIVVCTYLVHRHPGYWARPDEFLPERWANPNPQPAYLPFGFGPHTCAGATIAMSLLEDLIRVITRDSIITITEHGDKPMVASALAPPRFTAEFVERFPAA